MSWKSLVCASLICALASPVWAQPTLSVTPSAGVNAQGNRVWTVQVHPNAADLPGSLAVEMAFTHTAGDSILPVGIVGPSAPNGGANNTWYYNETSAGSGQLLWNITENDPSNLEQNPGNNPFTGTVTESLWVDGANLFASLGSTIHAVGTTSVNTLQIVTQGGGGILSLGDSIIAQAGENHNIAAQNFYIPGDFTGDGRVTSADFDELLGAFGGPPGPGWQGSQPVGPNVGSPDFDALLQNFGAGSAFGSGAGLASAVVPEPTAVVILGLGALLLGLTRRRRS